MNCDLFKEYFFFLKKEEGYNREDFVVDLVEFVDNEIRVHYSDNRTSMSFEGMKIFKPEDIREYQINKIINGTNNN